MSDPIAVDDDEIAALMEELEAEIGEPAPAPAPKAEVAKVAEPEPEPDRKSVV